jgi:hypothetical protein
MSIPDRSSREIPLAWRKKLFYSISQDWNFLPRNLGIVADSHWAYRALESDKRKGITIIDERELMEFLELEKSTFAIFRVRLRDKEKNLYAYLGPELI